MSPILTRLAAPSVVLLTLLAIAGCASAGPEATVKRYAGELGFQLQVPDNEALKPPGGKMEPVGMMLKSSSLFGSSKDLLRSKARREAVLHLVCVTWQSSVTDCLTSTGYRSSMVGGVRLNSEHGGGRREARLGPDAPEERLPMPTPAESCPRSPRRCSPRSPRQGSPSLAPLSVPVGSVFLPMMKCRIGRCCVPRA